MVTLSWCDGRLRMKAIGLLLQSLQHISVKRHHDAGDVGGGAGFMHFGNWDGGSSLS